MGKHQFSDAERFAVYSADRGKCFWCGIPVFYRDVHIDHCIPERLEDSPAELQAIRKNYGLPKDFRLNGFENWVTSHQGCNLRKTDDILPNAPATLFILSQLIQRSPKLEAFRQSFEKDILRDRVLVRLRSALKAGTVEGSDIAKLIDGLPPLQTPVLSEPNGEIHLSERWSILVPGSPAAHAEAQGWKVHEVSGNIAFVNDGRVAGIVPNVARPDSSWICSQCGAYGPWDSIICRNCGNREEPD